jgi:hypothetical protein
VSIVSIVVPLALLKWRLSYMKSMREVGYDLGGKNEDVDVVNDEDNEDATDAGEEAAEDQISFTDLEHGLEALDLNEAALIHQLKAQIMRLKNLRRSNTANNAAMEKRVPDAKRIKQAPMVKKLVEVEKRYAIMTLALEDAPQLGINVYVLAVTKKVTAVASVLNCRGRSRSRPCVLQGCKSRCISFDQE